MRNVVLILAIAAMVYGARTYLERNPDLMNRAKELIGSSEKIFEDDKDGSRKKARSLRAVSTISRGQQVEIDAVAADKGRTIIEFTADW